MQLNLVPPNESAKYDYQGGHHPPVRSYLIASTPRTGSSLLCSLLWASGVAGAPNEYANPLFYRPLSARWGVSTEYGYVRNLIRLRTSPAGVFGMKLHAYHASKEKLASTLIQRIDFQYIIRLRRKDRYAQATSLERALVSRRWSSLDQDREVHVTDAGVARRLEQINRGEEYWDTTLSADCRVVDLAYEDLARDPNDAAAFVLSSMGIEHRVTEGLKPIISRLT